MRPFRSTINIGSFLFLFFCLAACQQEDIQADPFQGHPRPQAEKPGEPDPKTGCEGQVYFPLEYDILSSAEYPGTDLAVQFYPPTLPPLSNSSQCEYAACQYCLTLSFSPVHISKAAYTYRSDPQKTRYPILKDGKGGYQGHNPLKSIPDLAGGGSSTHTICGSPSDDLVILFEFEANFPAGLLSNNAAISAGGICIIDNIPDPNG